MKFISKCIISAVLASSLYAEADDSSSKKHIPLEQKGILELKNANTVLSIGGRIQLDTVYGWPEGSHFAAKVPLEDSGENGQLFMDARYSRFWIKTRTPSDYGPVRALLEIDFLGTAKGTENTTNSHGPRLRHAYVEVNGLTFGQTNSAFNAFVTLDTVAYVLNDTFVRQPLIRYSIDKKRFGYDISIEQPESTLLNSDGSVVTPQDDISPDIIGRIRYYPNWGEAAVAVLGRYITQDMEVGSKKDSKFGWGVNTSAKIKVYKLNDIRFDAQYGVGIGRYLAYNAFASGSLNDEGYIKLQHSYGAHLGYRHWWQKDLRSTFSVSYAGTKNNLDGISADGLKNVNRYAYGTQINLLWTPIKNLLIGAEHTNANRRVESNELGKMQSLRMIMRYDF